MYCALQGMLFVLVVKLECKYRIKIWYKKEKPEKLISGSLI
jgi:hypothetical protein